MRRPPDNNPPQLTLPPRDERGRFLSPRAQLEHDDAVIHARVVELRRQWVDEHLQPVSDTILPRRTIVALFSIDDEHPIVPDYFTAGY